MIRIIIAPLRDVVPGYKRRDGEWRYRATLTDGTIVCPSSREPFFDAARALLDLGHDPDEALVMRHAGSDIDAIISTIGKAAKWAIREDDDDGPRHVRYRSFPRGNAQDGPKVARARDDSLGSGSACSASNASSATLLSAALDGNLNSGRRRSQVLAGTKAPETGRVDSSFP